MKTESSQGMDKKQDSYNMQYWEQYCQLRNTARSLIAQEQPVEITETAQEAQLKTDSIDVPTLIMETYAYFQNSLQLSHKASMKQYDTICSLQQAASSIQSQKKSLYDQTKSLVNQKRHLQGLNGALKERLVYYKELDVFESELQILMDDSYAFRKSFTEILGKLEKSIHFFSENPHYSKSSFYLRSYRSLLQTCLDQFVDNTKEAFILFYAHPENFYKKHPNSEELHSIFVLLHERNEGVFREAVSACAYHYSKSRSSRLHELIREKHEQFQSESSVASLTRMVCELVLSYWNKEAKLHSSIFPQDLSLKDHTSSFFTPLYELVRERLIFEQDVDVLCEISQMIKLEFLEAGLEIYNRTYQDAQERIIYTVGFFISENISSTPGDRSLSACISLLSKLINRVQNDIFLGLATDAVNNCLLRLKASAPADDFIDGHAFLIRHILILRKQLIAMSEQMNLSYTEKSLDFSDTKQLFWRLVQGQVSLQKEGILAQLVSSAAPKYTESSQDLRKDVEAQLSQACQSLVIKVFHEVCNPIIVFLTKTRFSGGFSYEDAQDVLTESSNKIMQVFPRFKTAVEGLLDEKNKQELINSTCLQILKAFRQLVNYMEKAYQGQPLPSLLHIQTLLQNDQ